MNQGDTEIKELFRKYLNEQLTGAEAARLKVLVADMDEKMLDDNLQQIWSDYAFSGQRNRKAFDKVSANLKEIIQPGKERKIVRFTWQNVAAVLLPLFILTASYLYMDRESIKNSITQEYQVIAEKGQRASVILPDGTKVYLNSQTKLTYPASFALNHRTVNLTGEAYFEVTHDKNSPFIVSTPDANVKVLGTTFNLYAYPGNALFEASLIEGKVEVIPHKMPDKSVFLTPGQKVCYDVHTGKLKVSNTDLRVETAWKRGDLLFRSQSFVNILSQLESFFGAKIEVEGNYPTELFTGTFHEDNINQVLQNLQQHYKFKFRKSGDDIYITFK